MSVGFAIGWLLGFGWFTLHPAAAGWKDWLFSSVALASLGAAIGFIITGAA